MAKFRTFVGRLPLSLKIPVLVASLTVLVAVAISQIVLSRLAEEQTTSLRNLTAAFMDGVSTAITPGLLRRDVWETFDSLDRARRQYSAIDALFVVVILPSGEVLAASEPRRFAVSSQLPENLTALVNDGRSLIIDERKHRAWLIRALEQEEFRIGSVLAEIDIGRLMAVRAEVLVTLVVVNAGLTLLFGAAGYLIARRMIRPLSIIQQRLASASTGRLQAIERGVIKRAGPEYAELYRRFNAMIEAQAEREAMAAELANQEKLAMLGRLASGMAHEVNNPLGGLMNAVDTLDVHGDDANARRRSVDLLRRGLAGIQNVVRAALVTYKSAQPTRQLTHADLEDLPFLIQHETGSKQLSLSWRNELPNEIPVDASAVRQIALNLLLNACAASPERGEIAFIAAIVEDALWLAIKDNGPGLPEAAHASVAAGAAGQAVPPGQGLGLWTAARIAARLGGELRLCANPSGGSSAEFWAPLAKEREDALAVA